MSSLLLSLAVILMAACVLGTPGYHGHGNEAVSYQNNNLGGHGHHEVHGYGHGHGHKEVDYYAHPKYQYSYGVSDHHTGDQKTASEHRDGDTVKGHYSLLEPDGSWRHVNYVSDHGGFRAEVSRTKGHHPHNSYGHGHGHGY